jgi:hypothetical protein
MMMRDNASIEMNEWTSLVEFLNDAGELSL